MPADLTLTAKCQEYLEERWNSIVHAAESQQRLSPLEPIPEVLAHHLRNCLTSKTKSYRYVLPTQLLSKSVDHSLDCRSLQAAFESEGSFDARTIAHKVIVPFEKRNHDVLGGSNEPYVNNPLRCKSVSAENRARQKNKDDWDKPVDVLAAVEQKDDPNFTRNIFDHILLSIYDLLSDVHVIYPAPGRISLEQTVQLIENFISERSGGERLEAVATSLLKTISERFNLFDKVKRERTTAPDSQSGMVADIECRLRDNIVLLVEVKDRMLSLTQLDAKVDAARANQIKEILFIAQKGIDKKNKILIETRIAQEFTSGQNIYVTNLVDFAKGIFILLGESGRIDFVTRVGGELDRSKSSIQHRRAWAKLLKEL